MIFLCKLVITLMCVVSVVNASTRSSNVSKDFDEIDLVTGAVIKKKINAEVSQNVSVQGLEELESSRRRSGDETGDSKGDASGHSFNITAYKKWIWAGALFSWSASVALIGCECGLNACEADSAIMVCGYVLGGLGTAFGVFGWSLPRNTDSEGLLA